MSFSVARIREVDCVGCTKCIDACPVDAIIGTQQMMHTVLLSECIGCALCIAPCPMDCIEMDSQPSENQPVTKLTRAKKAKQRYLAKNIRRSKEMRRLLPSPTEEGAFKAQIQTEINAAIDRVKHKKAILAK